MRFFYINVFVFLVFYLFIYIFIVIFTKKKKLGASRAPGRHSRKRGSNTFTANFSIED